MRVAVDALVAADPRLARIEQDAGPLPWRTRPEGFASLLHIVVGQVISSQAAAAIWGRLSTLPDALTPSGLLSLPDAALRTAGLSGFKAAHARALAQACADGRLDVPGLARLPDAEALQRPDVLPAGDVAVAGAAQRLFGLPVRPNPRALRQLAEPWAPYRAIAARLLWHHWRHVTGRPSTDDLATAPALRP